MTKENAGSSMTQGAHTPRGLVLHHDVVSVDRLAAKPARVLGPLDAACVVIGAIVGVGIFFTPSRVALLAGSPGLAMLTWCIAGVIALCGALTFAELGGRYHAAGAQYQILRDAYGPLPGFLFVFCNATAVQAGAIGIIAVICARNLAIAAGAHELDPRGQFLAASALIALVTIANLVGVKWGSRIQNLTVFSKVLTLIVITALALFLAPNHPTPAPTPASPASGNVILGILGALVPTLFAFGGWQHALWISGEVKDPARNLPRAILAGTVIVIAIYLLSNWAYLHLLGYQGVTTSKALAADAVSAVYPRFGARVIAAAVGVSAFGVLNAQLLSGPRLLQSMASDGRFFASFANLHPRFRTPIAAIALLSATALILLALAGFDGVDTLLTGAVFIDGVFFALTGAALIILRRRHAPAPGQFRVPLYPIVPLIFVIGELGVVAGSYVDRKTLAAALIGVGWIVAATLLYLVAFRKTDRAV